MSPLLILDLFLALVAAHAPLVHPHVPKAVVLGGAGGKAVLTYFTVPYNPQQVASLPAGRDWHMGFAFLDVQMPMACGDVQIPAHNYKLNVRKNEDGEFQEVVLVPRELVRRRRGDPDMEGRAKELAAQGIPAEILLPMAKYDAEDDEHLTMTVLHKGYEAVQRGSSDPKSGAAFTLYMSFGNLHRKVDLQEVYPAPEKGQDK